MGVIQNMNFDHDYGEIMVISKREKRGFEPFVYYSLITISDFWQQLHKMRSDFWQQFHKTRSDFR
jgi:hypothetical protein